jgi:XTP/dITP diphosphohydrolase
MPGPSGVESSLEIVMATSNAHKLEEANFVLKEFGVVLVGQDIKGVEIQSLDPVEVAKASLEAILPAFDRPLVVEDTGLCVKALEGFPGALASHAARTIGNRGILKLLEGEDDRSAYFEAAVAYGVPPDQVWIFTGRAHGSISKEVRGERGFGFDPIFVPSGHSRTFAQMTLEEKSGISHRALAFRRLGSWVTR